MSVGISELLLIIVIAVVVIKPDKIGEYAKTAGTFVRKFKEAKDGVAEDVSPVTDAVHDMKETVEDLKNVVSDDNEKGEK